MKLRATIAIAALVILAFAGISQYRERELRAKLAKIAATVAPLKLAVAQYNYGHGTLAALPGYAAGVASPQWQAQGLPTPTGTDEIPATSYSVAAGMGVIRVKLRGMGRAGIDDKTVSWTPAVVADGKIVTWVVTSDGTDPTLLKTIATW